MSVVGRDSIEAPAVAAGIRAVLAGQRERIQLEYACHSPQEQRWFVLRANRFGGDGPVRVVVAHEDVTVRRHAENLVRQSEERYRSLINTARDGIFTLAADGTFRSMNPAIESIAGISAADWIGKPFAPLIHPDDLPLALERFQRILSGQPAPIYELRIHPSRERPVVMEFMLAPQADEGGQVIGVLGIGREITERKQAQADLERVHRQLQEASRLGGMAEIATNVLHNVGNVLNSVNVSTSLLVESVQQSRAANLGRVVGLLQAHAPDLAAFITEDPKGKQLPAYLAQLATHLMADQTAMTRELDSLRRNVEHIKEIVAMQQNYATFGGVKEMINLVDLIEDSLRINTGALNRHRVRIIREFAPVPPLNVEKHKILQILVNLLRNAKHACQESDRADRQLTVRLVQTAGRIQISVTDNGVGIPPENLSRIFSHGFTTRKNGHGFGLHSGALAAQEIGGSLTAHSAGPGHGATFTLDLPGPADADHAP
ncbi:MAG: PAS domain S-box protein [Verrucomicrobiota bacterium]